MPTLSVLLPYLSASRCAPLCLDLLARNTATDHEVVEVVDCGDPYDAFNLAAERASGKVLVFLNDDMFVAPGWDAPLVAAAGERTIVTSHLVESGRVPVNHRNLERDFGRGPASFRYEEFAAFAEEVARQVPEVAPGFGWYMPFAVRREDFVPFPNEKKGIPNDVLLFGTFASRGYRFLRAASLAYHLQRMTA